MIKKNEHELTWDEFPEPSRGEATAVAAALRCEWESGDYGENTLEYAKAVAANVAAIAAQDDD